MAKVTENLPPYCFGLGREGMAQNTTVSNVCGTSPYNAAIWSSVQARSVISSLYDLIQIVPGIIAEWEKRDGAAQRVTA